MYEITYIAKEEKENAVREILAGLKAKIISEDSLGRRKFAYKIAKETAGFYTTIVFEIDPQKLAEITKKLTLESGILRYLLVKKKPQTKREIVKPSIKIPNLDKTEKITKEIEKITKEAKSIDTTKPEKAKKSVGSEEVSIKKTRRTKIEKLPKNKKKTKKIPEKEMAKPTSTQEPKESDEDRLKKLDEKLDELLKE